MDNEELKIFLDQKYELYNRSSFVESDPIQIPKSFSLKEDIEISAFLSATIAWGQRPTIIRNAKFLVDAMDNQPLDFIINASDKDLLVFKDFKHRTFNGDDCMYFMKGLANIYINHGGLENVFSEGISKGDGMKGALSYFRTVFFELEHLDRTGKHISNVDKKSAAKRLNMFLRWMVRNDARSVDFGIWQNINPSDLLIPLDVHVARVARKLGLLERKQNDWNAVAELTNKLKEFDPKDPVKYDYALFGLGIFEKF